MAARSYGNFSCREATSENYEPKRTIIDENNLPDRLFQSLKANISPCKTYNFENNRFCFDRTNSHLIFHLNICSLQAYFDKLHDFLQEFSRLPSIIFISETRINNNPMINIDMPGYYFVHFPSPTKAEIVGAYLSTSLKFTLKDNLQLNVMKCEDLWFQIQFPGQNNNYTFAVIYRHPRNSLPTFIEKLDETMNFRNQKGNKVYIFGDINLDLNPQQTSSSISDYLQTLDSNGCTCLITDPTRVTLNSKTIIDHLLTNDCESKVTPGVISYKISDHFPIFCTASNSEFTKSSNPEIDSYTFRNIKTVDGILFRKDLEQSLTPLLFDLQHSLTTITSLNENFNKLVMTITNVTEKHATPKSPREDKNVCNKNRGYQKVY